MKSTPFWVTVISTIVWLAGTVRDKALAAEGPLASFSSPVKVELVVDGQERAVVEAVVSRQLISKEYMGGEGWCYAFAGECLFLECAYRGDPIESIAAYTLAAANGRGLVGRGSTVSLFTGVESLERSHHIIHSGGGDAETHVIGFSLQGIPLLAVREMREVRVVTTGQRAKTALLEKATAEPTAENLNAAAWLLATSPEAAVRDGKRAVALARRACEQAKWQDPASIDTLAAALAEMGDFPEAMRLQERALALDSLSAQERMAYESRLRLYRSKKSFRQE